MNKIIILLLISLSFAEVKYFKKTYPDKVAAGKWETGNAINYIATDKYTVSWITEEEYVSISATIRASTILQETKEKKIGLKKNIDAGTALGFDMSAEQAELDAL